MDVRIRVSIWESVAAGAAAWVVLNVFAYAAAPLLGVSFGATAPFFGGFLFPGAGPTVQIWVGRAVFLGAALGWSLVYRWAGGYLPGSGWLRGLVFGTGIWLVSALLLPLFGYLHPSGGSVAQPGFMGLAWRGGAGLVLSVLAHQVYGVTLATLTTIQERRA